MPYQIITDLSESRLFPSKKILEKVDEKILGKDTLLTLCALRILLADRLTRKWAKTYVSRTLWANNFDHWRSDATDLYALLYALSAANVINQQPFILWLRYMRHLEKQEENRTHQFFARLDDYLRIHDGELKLIRRNTMNWDRIENNQRDVLVTRLLRQMRLRIQRSELYPHLAHLAKENSYDLDQIGKDRSKRVAETSFLASLASLAEAATSGATSSGSVATVVGGLGAGFDSNQTWRSIYGKPKKHKSTQKPLIIRR